MKKIIQKSTFLLCSLLGPFFLLRAQSQPIQHIHGAWLLPDSLAQTPSGGKEKNMKDCHDLIFNSFLISRQVDKDRNHPKLCFS